MSMNITPIASVVIPAVKFDTLVALDASSTSTKPLSALGLPDASASVVDFSTLAQLLAATVVFQTQEAQQALAVADGTVTTSDFSQLSATATFFVDAFNRFQTSVDTLANSFGSAFEVGFLLAIHTQNVQLGADHAQSFIDSLAQVGIHFQDATDVSNPNQFKIDLTALEAAFKADPAQTTSLLENALKGLSAIEAKLLGAESKLNLNLFASDSTAALPTPVPAKQVDDNAVTEQLASLSSADAQKVSSALQHLLADEALSAAIDAHPISTQSATPQANVAGLSDASSLDNLPAEKANAVPNTFDHRVPVQASFAGFASLTAAQIAEAGHLNFGRVLQNFPVENIEASVIAGHIAEPMPAAQVAAGSVQISAPLPHGENAAKIAAQAINGAATFVTSGKILAPATATQKTVNSAQNELVFSPLESPANKAEQANRLTNTVFVNAATTAVNTRNLITQPTKDLPNQQPATPVAPALAERLVIDGDADLTDVNQINLGSRASGAIGQRAIADAATGTVNKVSAQQLHLPFSDTGETKLAFTAKPESAAKSHVAQMRNTPVVADAPVLPFNDLTTPVSAPTPPTTTKNLNQTAFSSVEAAVNNAPSHLQTVPINPLIAAAVAAYRIGETIVGTPRDEVSIAASEIVPDVSVIPQIAPVKMDPHDASTQDGRNQAELDAAKTLAQRAELKLAYANQQ